jgi:hypothetical protein
MARRMARAGVAVATVASLGFGGLAVATVAAAPAGAATSSSSSAGQTVDQLVAEVDGTVANLDAQLGPDVSLAESLACFPLELLLDGGPPLPPPGTCSID